MNFWSNFWPAFVATICGVALGIPTGIWINLAAGRVLNRKQTRDDERRRVETLEAIKSSIIANNKTLSTLESLPDTPVILFEPDLDLASWDMGKDDVRRLVRRAGLRIQLALYFQGIESLRRLVAALNDYTAGVNAAMGGAGQTQTNIRQRIRHVAGEAMTVGVSVLADLSDDDIEVEVNGNGATKITSTPR